MGISPYFLILNPSYFKALPTHDVFNINGLIGIGAEIFVIVR